MALSVVILNWARPGNVKTIARAQAKCQAVGEIIIWNNARKPFELACPKTVVINPTADLALRTRWAAATIAGPLNNILFQDDDLLLPAITLERMNEECSRHPDQIHCLLGRNFAADDAYESRDVEHTADIVLTRAAAINRALLPAVIKAEAAFYRAGHRLPPKNGEDIFMSLAVTAATGRRHQVLCLPWRELTAGPESLCARLSHRPERSAIVRDCQKFFGKGLTPAPSVC